MHHHLANQDLARLRYAEAVRSSVNRHPVAVEAVAAPSVPSLAARVRLLAARLASAAHTPVPRATH